jgi:hypothetical protein
MGGRRTTLLPLPTVADDKRNDDNANDIIVAQREDLLRAMTMTSN